MFAPGDTIRCIDKGPSQLAITKDKLYVVVRMAAQFVYIIHDQGKEGGYRAARFVLEQTKAASISIDDHAAEYEEIMAAQEIMKDA